VKHPHYEIITLCVSEFAQNCRILAWPSSAAIVVDPGAEAGRIIAELRKRKLELREIWLTHSHLDHCGGVADLLAQFPVTLRAHPCEQELRQKVEMIAQMYGLGGTDMRNCPEPSELLRGGESLQVEDSQFEVKFVPGHSPGHVCFYDREAGILLAGDTLFSGSIGRTDLPGGDHALLISGIQREILSLPGETRVLPGHGPDTTVEAERSANPFLVGS
jgi:hydroxyacylglutathione hydrolase